jgi:hypothetical protein
MATQAPRVDRPPAGYDSYEEDRGRGWVMFAGVLLVTLGAFNMIGGIAAIGSAHFYAGNAHYVFGDLNSWGWVVLWLGVIEIVVGFGIFAKSQAARWAGVVIVSLNALAQLLMIPAYPFWSLAIFAVDIVAIYGLVAYGQKISDH